MKYILFIICIFLLAFLLRVYKISQYPVALYGDEQSFAWNAYNILKLGRDEYGVPYPLQFRAFDDYKSPVPVYILVPFFKLLGMNAFSIRLPIVIASSFTVLISVFLFKLFFGKKVSLIAGFLFALSPWHIHLSRGFFESTFSLLFFVSGVYLFLSAKNLKKFIFSALSFVIAIYSYFTPRILIPFFLIFLVVYKYLTAKKNIASNDNKNFLIFTLIIIILSTPLIYLAIFDNGMARIKKLNQSFDAIVAKEVVIERNASLLPPVIRVLFHNKIITKGRMVMEYYLEHFSVNFWYIYGDNSLRYFLGKMGMFYIIEMPLMIIGLYKAYQNHLKQSIFFVVWLLLAPIPASLVGRSFALRSLAMLPAPFAFIGLSINDISNNLKMQKFRTLSSLFICILFSFSLGLWLMRYFLEYPIYAATWWGWENKAAFDYAKSRESNYDKIYISDFYTGSVMAYAVYNSIDPNIYIQAIANPQYVADGRKMIKIGKYYFGSLDLNPERITNKIIPDRSLYIGRPEEPAGEDDIRSPGDKRIIFVVHDTRLKDCYINNLTKCL